MPVIAICRRSQASSFIRRMKPSPSAPSRASPGKLHILEEQLGRVLRVHAELFEIAALREARKAAIDQEQRDAFGAGDGSVFATMITTSAFWPLVIKVFWPLST